MHGTCRRFRATSYKNQYTSAVAKSPLMDLAGISGQESLAGVTKGEQLRGHPARRAAAMAQTGLDGRTHRSEGAMIFHDLKERIVAESAGSLRLEENPPTARPRALGANLGSVDRNEQQYRCRRTAQTADFRGVEPGSRTP